MKTNKITLAVLGFMLLYITGQKATAQEIRLNGFSANVFDDKVEGYDNNGYYRSGKIEGGFQWGTGIEVVLSPAKAIELKYLRQNTKFKVYNRPNVGGVNSEKDLTINYILLGANNYIPLANSKLDPYAGVSLGMAILSADANAISEKYSVTKFAWEIKLGTNIWLSDKIGLKLQTGLLSVVQSFGAGVFYGSDGASAAVSTYSTMYQFSLGGGLTFKLGGKK